MTYDTEKVDALLKAMELHFTPRSLVPELREAWEALRPQPEMEYVLPEWDEFASKGEVSVTKGGCGKVKIKNCDTFYRVNYESLREATRRPKADKVPVIPAGADWSYEDRLNIWESVKKVPGTEGIAYVIDHIKSKCGV